ncbi:MAG TPA: hypothetical protein PK347_09880 [Burkholderiaceae bacterium]|nr:hypothetical protein [Burkholderiaceae bacterium]
MSTNIVKFAVASAVSICAQWLPAQSLAGDADFTLVNRTGYAIAEVYVSPANKNSWGRDRLGRNILDNGRAKLFTFSDSANCMQDIMVVFDDDGSKVVWEDFDLCALNKITLRYNRKTDVVSADVE